jgi:hypothetical protein
MNLSDKNVVSILLMFKLIKLMNDSIEQRSPYSNPDQPKIAIALFCDMGL